ncbi:MULTISPECIES: DUF3019 domain-containing protein [Pseudoalteromonas]|uniref:DUF3019 domain-containing protein n=1 Tax=Pseudoalteromonas TaxID=53246 RepID=UPI0013036235|nr:MULTISPECIES: DUF3019 domain-containing protein [Pseudoalteromonas]
MKNIHKTITSLAFLCCTALCFNCFATSEDKPFFKVSPTVCITETKQAVCEFNIQVNFILTPFKELCIEISNRPQYTQCYTQNGLIEERFKIAASKEFKVQLIDPLSNLVIKEQMLSVANYEASDYRLRRRFGWSL